MLLYSLTISDPRAKGNPLVYVSSGFETLSGYSGDELLGHNARLMQVGHLRLWGTACGPRMRGPTHASPIHHLRHAKQAPTMCRAPFACLA